MEKTFRLSENGMGTAVLQFSETIPVMTSRPVPTFQKPVVLQLQSTIPRIEYNQEIFRDMTQKMLYLVNSYYIINFAQILISILRLNY
jgi:hypothetical protein